MRRFTRNSIFTFLFALAFVFVGVSVSAKEKGAINNTTISGYNSTFELGEQTFYVVDGNAQTATLKLKANSYGQTTAIGQTYYDASVHVYRCSDYNEEDKVCNTWHIYTYNNDRAKTMDALKSKGTLSLTFKNSNFVSAKTQGSVDGFSFSSATSAYDLEKTYFVAVQYQLPKLFSKDSFAPDVFRVLLAGELEGVKVTSEKNTTTGKTTVTILSGAPISNVKYFSTTTKLEAGYNFDTQYANSTNATELVTKAAENPEFSDGNFIYTFELEIADGEYYYVRAANTTGLATQYDIENNVQEENQPANKGEEPNASDGNIGNTDVGKIILIVLLVILVAAFVLVIVQKIVDYRKKLY